MRKAGSIRSRWTLLSATLVTGLLVPLSQGVARLRPTEEESISVRDEESVRYLREAYGEARTREPGDLAENYTRMSNDVISYFGGAHPVFYRDMFGSRGGWSRGLTGPTALLVGDATIFNVGTFRDGAGSLVFDFMDLTQSARGPIGLDLRRLLVSLALTAGEMASETLDVQGILLEAIHAYRDGLAQFSDPAFAAEWKLTADRGNPLVRRFLRDASHHTRADLLDRWTVMTMRGRKLRSGNGFCSVDPAHLAGLAEATIRLLPGAPAGYFAVKDAMRRTYRHRGWGGHETIYLLVEGATCSPDDDVILEATVRHQATLEHFFDSWTSEYDSVDKIVATAGRLHHYPAPFMGAVRANDVGYVVKEVQPWEMRVTLEEMAGVEDLFDLARTTGTLLAHAHAGTADAGGIREFLSEWMESATGIESDWVSFAIQYSKTVHRHYRAFRARHAHAALLDARSRRFHHHVRVRKAKDGSVADDASKVDAIKADSTKTDSTKVETTKTETTKAAPPTEVGENSRVNVESNVTGSTTATPVVPVAPVAPEGVRKNGEGKAASGAQRSTVNVTKELPASPAPERPLHHSRRPTARGEREVK